MLPITRHGFDPVRHSPVSRKFVGKKNPRSIKRRGGRGKRGRWLDVRWLEREDGIERGCVARPHVEADFARHSGEELLVGEHHAGRVIREEEQFLLTPGQAAGEALPEDLEKSRVRLGDGGEAEVTRCK